MSEEKKTADAAFAVYARSIIHSWSKTLATLGFTLIPIFFILDYFMMPSDLLTRFALYRLITTSIVIGQYFVITWTPPSRASFLHGYFFSCVVAGMITLMTTDLGGFNSTYYAGLNLVMIATNLMLPWRPLHSFCNSVLIIATYVGINSVGINYLALDQHLHSTAPVDRVILVNNLYFLTSTAIISVAINWVKERLIREEFSARSSLQAARDALWGEMEVAKRIQTSLAPRTHEVRGYRIAASTTPANEVGGDYYDIIENEAGDVWISIGDVSGHGVESGLIMMMTQTSIFSTIAHQAAREPRQVLEAVNHVLKENIMRLGADRYVTLSTLALRGDQLVFAGKHQDILVFHRASETVEAIPTTGTWLGVLDDLHLQDHAIALAEGDIVLLFTDGVTEAMNEAGVMYGERNLQRALSAYANLGVETLVQKISAEVQEFMAGLQDDMTLVAFERTATGSLPPRLAGSPGAPSPRSLQ